ncbi:MAG TPA: ABC transporter permease [Bryobacteraceae bacterium]|jgi:predicted permease|nr:ABC transporter permease [Bryobacteraceae bacterium]
MRFTRTLHFLSNWLLHRSKAEADLKDELFDYVARQTERYLAAGLTLKEAERAAARDVGSLESLKDTCRDVRHTRWIENIWQDLRYAARTLRNSPSFTLVVLICLALAIGANTAIFSVMNALMIRTLPVQQPEQLALLGNGQASGTNDDFAHNEPDLFSWPFFNEIRKHSPVFSDILAVRSFGTTAYARYSGAGDLEQVHVRFVSGNYFSVLGVRASAGRVLLPEDDRARGASPPVAVLRYGYWQRRFARDGAVIGRTVQINGLQVTITGVAAPAFFGVVVGSLPDFWIPLTAQAHNQPSSDELFGPLTQSLWLIGRLKPRISLAQAQANTDVRFRQWLHAVAGSSPSPEQMKKMERAHVTLTDASRGPSRLRRQFSRPLQIVMALVGLVLLIACANIANLLLARSSAREKEMGLRIALGASPGRLLAQLLCESLLLSFTGGCLGLLLSFGGVRLLLAIVASGGTAVPLTVELNGQILAFCFGVSVLTGLMFGVAPALRLTRVNVSPALKEGRSVSGSRSHTRLGHTLVVVQVSLAYLLILSAALFVSTFRNLEQSGIGFDMAKVLVLQIDSGSIASSPAALLNLYRSVEARIRQLPGVDAASFAELTFHEGHWRAFAWPEGAPRTEANGIQFNGDHVGDQYFQALGTPIILGRGFGPQDTMKSQPVAVVNETFARTLFPHVSPIGRRFSLSEQRDDGIEIVGIVKDVRYESVRERPVGAFFVSNSQDIDPDGYSDLVIRTRLSPQQFIPEVRTALRSANPGLVISGQKTLTEQVDDSLGKEKLLADLAAFFAIVALLLACIGIYGVVAYSVARRRNEIGVRIALGARPADVLGGVLHETFSLVFAGLGLGLPLALLFGRVVGSQLYGVQSNNPLYIAVSAALLSGTSLIAGFIPGRRAARLDPLIALREE